MNTTGEFNTASGAYTLLKNTTGRYNTATGADALAENTTGYENSASGGNALGSNTSGNLNTASGYDALRMNSTGWYNTADGYWALRANTKGMGNTASGYLAGSYNLTGSYNTFLGYQASTDQNSYNLTNATAIGANAVVSQSNAVVLGGTGSNAVKVGIGTATPTAMLDVRGTGNFTDKITFAPGQTFPGTGTITGVTAGTDLTGGGTSGNVTLNVDTSKVVTGVMAGTDLTGGGTGGVQTLNLDTTKVPQLNSANTFTGNQAVNGNLSATGTVTGSSFGIASNLFAFGSYSLENAFLGFAGNTTTTGTGNTASGWNALAANTTGSRNTAYGGGALSYNNTGWENTATGYNALYSNTTGNSNTATGLRALYSNTTGSSDIASGFEALYSNTTGSYNTATGIQALYSNTTGFYNTASGMQALSSNTTGYYNTGLGFRANVGSGNLQYATAIGANAVVSQSNSLVLGGTGSYAVRVGIGTATPSNVFAIGQYYGSAIADGWGTYSSRRWKTNIHPLANALGKIEQLRGVSYDLKQSGKHEIGVIAEEVGAVVPEIVSWDKNGKDALGVDYSRLTALLIEATKQQQALIRKQQSQIKAQQIQIQAERTRSEARFALLTSQVKAIQASLKTNNGADAEVRTAAVHVPRAAVR